MKLLLTTSYVVVSVAMLIAAQQSAYASANNTRFRTNTNSAQVIKSNPHKNQVQIKPVNKFHYDANLGNGKYVYIIEFNELALAQDPFTLSQLRLAKKNRFRRTKTEALSSNSLIKSRLQKIDSQQQSFMQKAKTKIFDLSVLNSYRYGINAVAVKLTQDQAQTLLELPEIKRIEREKKLRLDTDTGPNLIGSPAVWTGAVTNIAQTQGEGIIIAIIDSGINTDHPSFAEVSGDGYIHTNPLGDGVYLGDCAGQYVELCNNKLIGVYSYPDITDDYADTAVFPPNMPRNGEDYDGHGSHVASTAAGNVLFDVDEVYPTQGEIRSSGTPTGFTFDRISGVAPRANIISYQVCWPGSEFDEDTYSGCSTSASLKAIDDAIKDNVDVINYSISGGGEPWSDSVEQAFFSARSAGIFVATSAGNDGAEASTSSKNAPWYTSVAASEHGRENIFAKQLHNFSGGTSSLGALSGRSNSGSITANIVYAGDYSNSNDPSGDPAQCLEPFPAGTFSGQIVVCDRGEIARVQKAINVRDGGAGGYVLVNIDGGDTFFYNDEYVVPGIHMSAENGNKLKAWLATGQNHQATITVGVASQSVDPTRVDVIAEFSSRGPNVNFAMLVPTLTAPGKNIYAAYANEQLGHDQHEPAAANFNYLDGTSMSSPHVAGGAALLKAAHPDWDPDHIRSALSFTASTVMQKEDASTAADFFDMGAGRIQVSKAIASGLIMSETMANYTAANPRRNGDPRSLNLPSITDNDCAGACLWSRTFTATTDATWTFSNELISSGLNITASPSVFTLLEGQSQTLTFEINNSNTNMDNYAFGLIKLSSPGLPTVHLPVSTLLSIGNIQTEIEMNSTRAIDSIVLNDIELMDIDNFVVTAYKPVKATIIESTLAEDPSPNNYLDNLAQVHITEINVAENTQRLIAEIKTSSANDIDLYLIFDSNNNGIPTITEQIAASTLSGVEEEISINFPNAGRYFLVVQNRDNSSRQVDEFELQYALVTNELADDELQVIAPSSVAANVPFDIRLIHNLPDASSGDNYYAAVGLGTDYGNTNLGIISLDINRIDDDVSIDAIPRRISTGEVAPIKIVVSSNPTSEDRIYEIIVPVPVGTETSNYSTAYGGKLVNNEISWLVNKPAGDETSTELNFDITLLQGVLAGPINIEAKSILSKQSFSDYQAAIPFTDIQVEGGPIISFNGDSNITLNVIETLTLSIPLSISEPNNDAITVQWTQSSGPTSSVSGSEGSYTIQAPSVTEDTQLIYQVSVSDNNGNIATGIVTINVLDNSSPIISSIDLPSSANGGQNITLSVIANDPENDTLSITVNGQSIQGSATTLLTPTSGNSVNYIVEVSDGITSVSQTLTVTLTQEVTNGATNDESGGGTMPLYIILLAPILWLRKPAKQVSI